jgi:hypothetical protein
MKLLHIRTPRTVDPSNFYITLAIFFTVMGEGGGYFRIAVQNFIPTFLLSNLSKRLSLPLTALFLFTVCMLCFLFFKNIFNLIIDREYRNKGSGKLSLFLLFCFNIWIEDD